MYLSNFRSSTRLAAKYAATLLIAATLLTSAKALVLTATLAGTSDGSLAGVPFAGQTFSFSETYDTALLSASSGATYTPGPVSFVVSGAGSGSIGTLNFGIAPATGNVGVLTGETFPSIVGRSVALVGFSLGAPVASTPLELTVLMFDDVATSAGALTLRNISGLSLQVTQATSVPEEGVAAGLLGLALVGLMFLAQGSRRR